MSNTDGEIIELREELQRTKLLLQNCNGDIVRADRELASLREQLKQQEEVIRELIPIAQWGYDLLVPFDKERMGKEWPATIEKAKSLTTKDK